MSSKCCCCDDADQHERRTKHGVQEELRGCVNALVVSPTPNEEVHRNKNDLEEDEEQEQVEAKEAAHDSCFKQQQPCEIGLFIVVWINTENDQRKQNAGEHHEEQ